VESTSRPSAESGGAGRIRENYRRVVRWGPIVLAALVGIVALRCGVVWTLQGADLWGGSFMSGSSRWLVIGLLVLGGSVLVLVRTGLLVRRRISR
jgi:predicted branched-subunit amino acid permease